MSSATVEVGGRELRVVNLEKVLYPEAGFTKGQVIDYYRRMADILLPHLRGRPLTLKRYPSGVDQSFFYEKRCPSHKPDWVPTAKIWSRHNQETINYCLIDSVATLVWVANLASIELHTLLSKADDPDRPTSMVFDLDPGPPATIMDCIPVALRLRDVLANAGLESFVKVSGGKGLHLWVPLNTPVTFDQTKNFSRAIAQLLERHDPQHVTSNMRKELRKGRVFIDWSQNDQHKTTVCVYSLRARQEPTVSMPLTWEELKRAGKSGDPARLMFQADEAIKRVKAKGDLFSPILKLRQKLHS